MHNDFHNSKTSPPYKIETCFVPTFFDGKSLDNNFTPRIIRTNRWFVQSSRTPSTLTLRKN